MVVLGADWSTGIASLMSALFIVSLLTASFFAICLLLIESCLYYSSVDLSCMELAYYCWLIFFLKAARSVLLFAMGLLYYLSGDPFC